MENIAVCRIFRSRHRSHEIPKKILCPKSRYTLSWYPQKYFCYVSLKRIFLEKYNKLFKTKLLQLHSVNATIF